jgi:hypothetical protein
MAYSTATAAASRKARGAKEKNSMSSEIQKHSEYDFPTAVTFLVIGLAVGSFLAVLFSSSVDRSTRNDRHSR